VARGHRPRKLGCQYAPSVTPVHHAVVDLIGAFVAAFGDQEDSAEHVVAYRSVLAIEDAYAELGTSIAEWKQALAQ
jgi:hypothetical protein